MTDSKKLRSAGDFPNKSVVEYATVRVEIPHRLIPSNLSNPHYRDEDIVAGLYASPTGRLSYKTLYLDSVELAERFVAYLRQLFQNRPYAHDFALKIEVITTTQKVTATKGRAKHSAAVAETLQKTQF
ncbi:MULTISPECIES: hypothetical protein [unclassified Pseudomonas]|uniref:hypothetical protein n=1 Tax=unclassified Pseudomonas TaxID=196821 RepID=UPI00244C6CF7|nr:MULTISPECIES: hypothetical protein [unclassified Pseudomonas]MDG9929051.1 hypothetical protein [Pseudomonas sp. GD04042]MDH0483764.1 hypothetical protein [Pseudomonas sp. GD04015]MDH0604937.1 hypothetical protein [Pseudomonas sp. GD03869]